MRFPCHSQHGEPRKIGPKVVFRAIRSSGSILRLTIPFFANSPPPVSCRVLRLIAHRRKTVKRSAKGGIMATIKQKTERGVEVAWAAATTLQTAALEADLRRLSNEGLTEAFKYLRDAGKKSFLGMAICVGIAQERAQRGDNILDELSNALGKHRSRIAVLGQVYRMLIKPRLALQEGEVDFPLDEQVYYESAVRFAGRNAMGNASALDLLAMAEDAKLSDPSFSGRAFVEAVALRPETEPKSMSASIAKIDKALARLQKEWRGDAFRLWVEQVENPSLWADFLEDVATEMQRQSKTLRKRIKAARA